MLALSIALMLTLGCFECGSFGTISYGIATGVVTEVETSDDGALTGLTLLTGDGSVHRFTVSSSDPNTSFGLENRVGERWVSDLATDAREAATRLRDQQSRLDSNFGPIGRQRRTAISDCSGRIERCIVQSRLSFRRRRDRVDRHRRPMSFTSESGNVLFHPTCLGCEAIMKTTNPDGHV